MRVVHDRDFVHACGQAHDGDPRSLTPAEHDQATTAAATAATAIGTTCT